MRLSASVFLSSKPVWAPEPMVNIFSILFNISLRNSNFKGTAQRDFRVTVDSNFPPWNPESQYPSS